MSTHDPFRTWQELVDALGAAGRRLDDATAELDHDERADGVRALLRATLNQLDRVETDSRSPELVPFNTWRHKFFMDNPDCSYWVADIDDGGEYHLDVPVADSAFTSVTLYRGSGMTVESTWRTTTDDLLAGGDGPGGGDGPAGGDEPARIVLGGEGVAIPEGSTALWVRSFHDGGRRTGNDPVLVRLDAGGPPPPIDAAAFGRGLHRVAASMDLIAGVLASTRATEAPHLNTVREWSEMRAGAAFTEPGIVYHRGSWDLAPGQALVLRGRRPVCRHWSILAYSPYLNSLDHRNRNVSITGDRLVDDPDGTFTVVLAPQDPGAPNWIDTEGRRFGLFVIRALEPDGPVELPTARVTG